MDYCGHGLWATVCWAGSQHERTSLRMIKGKCSHIISVCRNHIITSLPLGEFRRTPFDVETKADASPVTIADKESETAMRDILRRVREQRVKN